MFTFSSLVLSIFLLTTRNIIVVAMTSAHIFTTAISQRDSHLICILRAGVVGRQSKLVCQWPANVTHSQFNRRLIQFRLLVIKKDLCWHSRNLEPERALRFIQ